MSASKSDKAAGHFDAGDGQLKKRAEFDHMTPLMALNTTVERLDETEEVAFVMMLIRADKHYVTGLLPTLLKNYLDERKITVRHFHQNLPSAAYMNGFLRRHGKYLAGVIQQPVASNSVTTKVNVVSIGQKQRKIGVQQPLGNDGLLFFI